ncbi:DUF488 domain-containing protein [Pulveribacter sp.]|uniref:DUF488 domain-containing protein n=1 Tax=Pulveribacter sp. TaxID=2678893 RepID=UPI00289823C3|nr:DUF488 family protein [Pulveribacter sp.]
MPVRIVRLGSPRAPNEGTRIGTVRRPPRGVPRNQFAAQDWYDAWLPNLAPSAEAVKQALAAHSDAEWAEFARRYRREMAEPDRRHLLDTLAQLSRQANFSVGCYCENEARCHRSLLRELLAQAGADIRED